MCRWINVLSALKKLHIKFLRLRAVLSNLAVSHFIHLSSVAAKVKLSCEFLLFIEERLIVRCSQVCFSENIKSQFVF